MNIDTTVRLALRNWLPGTVALLSALTGCMGYEVEQSDEETGEASEALLALNQHYDGFTITNYTVAQEAQLSGSYTGDSTLVCPSSLGRVCYHKEFLCSGWGVAMQGTGSANDGRYIKYVSGGGGWVSGYTWLRSCSDAVFAYASGVTGASSRTLVQNYSIAVDPAYVALGSYVWIDRMMRWYRADDTGGVITARHIDIYTGTSNPVYNFADGVYVTDAYHAPTDPNPYGAFSPVSLRTPTDGASDVVSPVTFSWYTMAGATSYRLQIAAVNRFDENTCLAGCAYNTASSSASRSVSLAPGNYYWRVRAGSPSAGGYWSNVRSFRVR